MLLLAARSDRVDRVLMRVIGRALRRWTNLEARDYVGLLHLGGGYGVNEMAVREGDWVEGRTLRELDLRSEGVAVLGIVRAGVGTPVRDTTARAGDTVVIYGPSEVLSDLDTAPRARTATAPTPRR